MVWIDRNARRLVSPLGDLEALAQDAHRFFADLGAPASPTTFPANVQATDDGLRVSMQVPGFGPDDIQVQLEGRSLKISGRLQDGPAFERSFRMPWTVDADQVEARVEHGLLELALPRVEAERPRSIPIRGAGQQASLADSAAHPTPDAEAGVENEGN